MTEAKSGKKRVVIITVVVAILLIGIVGVMSFQKRINSPAYQLSLGERYLTELDYEKAIVAFRKVIEIQPKNADAYLGLGEAYVGLGDKDKALVELEIGASQFDEDAPERTRIEVAIQKLLPTVEASVAVGEYETIQTIALTTDGEKIYYTLDGSEVTNKSEEYTQAIITPERGELTIKAAAATKSGRIGETATFTYTITPPDYVVEWVEPIVEQAVREYLGKGPDDEISASELEEITEIRILGNHYSINNEKEMILSYEVKKYYTKFSFPGGNYTRGIFKEANGVIFDEAIDEERGTVSSIRDFKHFPNLERLTIAYNTLESLDELEVNANIKNISFSNNMLTDASILGEYSTLEHIDLSSNPINNFIFISSLPNLKELQLANCGISNIEFLKGLDSLKIIDVKWNNISDISLLSPLVNLEELSLDENDISNLEPLAGLINLKALYITGKAITNIDVLAKLTKLESLTLFKTGITSLAPLSGLAELKHLTIIESDATDFSLLRNLVNLERISLIATDIDDITFLQNCSKLEFVEIGGAPSVTDISVLSDKKNLTTLNFGGVNITDLSPLSGLDKLEHFEMFVPYHVDLAPVSHVSTIKSNN